MRYFFEISYNGSNYHGWQNQKNAVGVQQVVGECLSKIFWQPLEITASGRTDTGVHCAQQFFHVDINKEFDVALFIQKLNSILPRDIAIRTIRRVKDDAHARYDAFERSYEYTITQVKDPMTIGRAYHFFKPLDIALMNRAAVLLMGEKDFECFSKVKTDVNHFICHLKKAQWSQRGDLLIFNITANRFLRGMVRAIVGTLLDVGSGKMTLKQFEEVFKGKDRRKAGMNVPPEGLCLTRVRYSEKIFIN